MQTGLTRPKRSAKPSALTSADGKVFASAVNTHTLFALDHRTGQIAWMFTADGRIDSPPAYYQGLVLFGLYAGGIVSALLVATVMKLWPGTKPLALALCRARSSAGGEASTKATSASTAAGRRP